MSLATGEDRRIIPWKAEKQLEPVFKLPREARFGRKMPQSYSLLCFELDLKSLTGKKTTRPEHLYLPDSIENDRPSLMTDSSQTEIK